MPHISAAGLISGSLFQKQTDNPKKKAVFFESGSVANHQLFPQRIP